MASDRPPGLSRYHRRTHPAVLCPSCRSFLEPVLPLCTACAHHFPERDDQTQAVIVRGLPPGAGEAIRLLAAASGQGPPAVARYLRRGPALFRIPASALILAALVQELTAAGAEVDVLEPAELQAGQGPWTRNLPRDPRRLLWLGGGIAGSGLLAACTTPGLALLALLTTGALAALDAGHFARRATLSPAVLARRLGFLPEPIARAGAALLRRARPGTLRDTLAAVLVEESRLLAAVVRGLRAHPALQGPFREALDELGQQTLRLAENALALEATDENDVDLPGRLAHLRTLGSAEVDQRLRELLTSRDARQTRTDWLRRTHALLIIRLETIAERLRGLRHDATEILLAATTHDDRTLATLHHELRLSLAAFTEVERALPEVVAEVVRDTR